MIDPIVLKGFRDSLPSEEIPKKNIERKLESVFEGFGFVPIDTPVLEYESVLLGKGGGETDKQIFHFEDNGGRKVAMRFDLTVPFARFLALHHDTLPIPFKRYHIAKAWRGENPQKGRYREFIQCDFDIVGVDNAEADFEILSLMYASFRAMGIQNVCFHVANRAIFNDFLETIDVKDKSIEILRAVDKLRKIGKDEVKSILLSLTGDEEKSEMIISFITSGEKKNFLETLDSIVSLIGRETENTERMRRIHSYLKAAAIDSFFVYDPSITRGLDYYTKTVFEFVTDCIGAQGTVCGGGRYDGLVEELGGQHLPSLGFAMGIERLLILMDKLGIEIPKPETCDIYIAGLGEKGSFKAFELASKVRTSGLIAETDVVGRGLRAQMKYADKYGARYVAVIGENEAKSGIVTLKRMSDGESKEVPLSELGKLCGR